MHFVAVNASKKIVVFISPSVIYEAFEHVSVLCFFLLDFEGITRIEFEPSDLIHLINVSLCTFYFLEPTSFLLAIYQLDSCELEIPMR